MRLDVHGLFFWAMRLPHCAGEHAGVGRNDGGRRVVDGLQLAADGPVHEGAVAVRHLGGGLCRVAPDNARFWRCGRHAEDERLEVCGREGFRGGEGSVAREEDVVEVQLLLLWNGRVENKFCSLRVSK